MASDGMFDDFIRGCSSDSVNARDYRYCVTCTNLTIPEECADCAEKRQRRDERNDAGADEA